ncbi:hypothetical protein BKA58DRAFT_68792 [Alternaria rosae]|uniref:uncharacterized protein n=1 Tax=Alternaria rosae TaxID=1187941 RepID=UPI001E8CFD7E|nr:uncharacterized protein BKA58DRAFT_68792 [Alternaria rosae]KAH6851443.1 hypothetical protein BKA58DRAFT_68792 [Alternaria rosae]
MDCRMQAFTVAKISRSFARSHARRLGVPGATSCTRRLYVLGYRQRWPAAATHARTKQQGKGLSSLPRYCTSESLRLPLVQLHCLSSFVDGGSRAIGWFAINSNTKSPLVLAWEGLSGFHMSSLPESGRLLCGEDVPEHRRHTFRDENMKITHVKNQGKGSSCLPKNIDVEFERYLGGRYRRMCTQTEPMTFPSLFQVLRFPKCHALLTINTCYHSTVFQTVEMLPSFATRQS